MAITSGAEEGLERIGGWGLAVAGLYALWSQLNKERMTRDELHAQHLSHIEDERKRTELLIDKLERSRIEADARADQRSEAFLNALDQSAKNIARLQNHCQGVWDGAEQKCKKFQSINERNND